MQNARSPANIEKPVVLIVDDEAAFGEALAFRLETRGVPCQCAICGDDALLAIAQNQFEVVLLDIAMPGMHGLKVLEIIKSQRPNLEVLLLTSEASITTAVEGMRLGASEFLLKPIDLDILLKHIEKARKHREDRKEHIRAAEIGKLLALKSLATGVGHEVNNPLQIITQSTGLLEELIDDELAWQNDQQLIKDTIKKIQLATIRCGKITAQLLGLASLDAKRTAKTNIYILLEKVAEQFKDKLAAQNITLRQNCAPNLPLLNCSPSELETVFVQLIANAIDAMDTQATCKTSVNHAPSLQLNINVDLHSKGIVIKIGDTGEGINADILPRIYEPFFSTRSVGKGVGLGLTVCHSIITALRGDIIHRPVLPQGTVCIVELPNSLIYLPESA